MMLKILKYAFINTGRMAGIFILKRHYTVVPLYH